MRPLAQLRASQQGSESGELEELEAEGELEGFEQAELELEAPLPEVDPTA